MHQIPKDVKSDLMTVLTSVTVCSQLVNPTGLLNNCIFVDADDPEDEDDPDYFSPSPRIAIIGFDDDHIFGHYVSVLLGEPTVEFWNKLNEAAPTSLDRNDWVVALPLDKEYRPINLCLKIKKTLNDNEVTLKICSMPDKLIRVSDLHQAETWVPQLAHALRSNRSNIDWI